jgi:hypothetical protein
MPVEMTLPLPRAALLASMVVLGGACSARPAGGAPGGTGGSGGIGAGGGAGEGGSAGAGGALAGLGVVRGGGELPACPSGAPAGATCRTITVTGCPGIEDPVDAVVAVLAPAGASRGTVVHFKGGGGQGFETAGDREYRAAGLLQVFVSFASDWEQTRSAGLRAAGCRPATILAWIFDDIHGASRERAFCGQGFSGGTAALGYALADHGLGDRLDYVNELSGPPFGRLDLACDGDAPDTAQVCGASVTTRLPAKVEDWENTPPPDACGRPGPSDAALARWRADSIAIGGQYDHPRTRIEFFACTSGATAVTAMGRLYYEAIAAPEGGEDGVAYHCYGAADGCHGEGLGSRGQAEATAALIAGCVPRHGG